MTTWPFVFPGDDPNDFEYIPRCIPLHSGRRTDRAPGWPPVPPGNRTDVAQEMVGSLLEHRAKMRLGLEV